PCNPSSSCPCLSYSTLTPPPPRSTLFPYTTLFRSGRHRATSSICRASAKSLSVMPPAEWVLSLTQTLPQVTARSAWCQAASHRRLEEHTSELQSRENLVCRLLLEKKK